MRLDTTVVETNIHYPTDSNLLGDGVRVLIRAMKRIGEIAGKQGAKLRDRSRSVKFRILEIGRIARPRADRIESACSRDTRSSCLRWGAWWDRPSDFPTRLPKG